MNIKKVLFVRTPPYDLNINTYNTQQIGMGKAFCDLSIDFDFITFKKKNCKTRIVYENNGHFCRVIEVPRFRFFRTGINTKITKKEFLKEYDLIISQEYYQIMSYLFAKKSNNVVIYSGPYWNLFHFKLTSYMYDKIFTKKIDKAVQCIFSKSILAKDFLEKKGYHNVFNIGVGLDFDKYKNINISEKTKELLGKVAGETFLLYVGRVDDNKNTGFLLDVFERVLLKYPNLKLVLIGKCQQSFFNKLVNKYNNNFLKNLLKKHSTLLKKNVIYVESLDNNQLQFIYRKASVFLLPSVYEIFGMVLLEAMYFGVPVISSYNGGAKTLIVNDEYGQIIEKFDVELWTNGIFKYLENENYRRRVIDTARSNVIENYNWPSIVKKILYYLNK